MKQFKIFALVLCLFFNYKSFAQGCIYPTTYPRIFSYSDDLNHKSSFTRDSLFYTVRGNCLEVLNINTGVTEHLWADHYPARKIIPDTNNYHIYLKSNNFIGRYNPLSGSFENLVDSSFGGDPINDIGISPDGTVWAVTFGEKIAYYRDSTWVLQALNLGSQQGFYDLRVVNDSVVYVSRGISPTFLKYYNNTFDSVYSLSFNGSFFDWDVSQDEVLWIARGNSIRKVEQGTNYDFIGNNNAYLKVRVAPNGNIWATGLGEAVWMYDGANLAEVGGGGVINGNVIDIALTEESEPRVLTKLYFNSQSYLYSKSDSTWEYLDFPFMPIKNVKAANYKQFATEEGLFSVSFYLGTPSISTFLDLSQTLYTIGVNCLGFSPDPNNFVVGTNTGLYGIDGFDNNELPNDTINHIYYSDGHYYIATNGGLVLYSSSIYSIIDTSNSPLPSNNITYVTKPTNNNYPIYIGTKKGVAFLNNDSSWTVFDTSNVPVNDFFVTGICPGYSFGDSAVYVSTLSDGLLRLFPSGGYELYNTANDNFEDDSLHYIMPIFLGKCGEAVLAGTKNHGIACWYPYSEPVTEVSYTAYQSGGDTLNYSSQFIAYDQSANNYNTDYIIVTDNYLTYATGCYSVEEALEVPGITWYQGDGQITYTSPFGFSGKTELRLFDAMGKLILSEIHSLHPAQQYNVDIYGLPKGLYVLSLIYGDKQATAKVIIQ